jgi:hypothetical protein
LGSAFKTAHCGHGWDNLLDLDFGLITNMEEVVRAALLFWLPLLLVPIGVIIALSRKEGRRPTVGWSLALISGLLVLLSWLTVPSSDSSAGGHLLLAVIGPAILMAAGCFLVIFSGQVPVRRLPAVAGPIGVLSVILGLGWLVMMHLYSPPIWRHQVNPYWLVWWPTFLLSVFMFSAFVIGGMLMVGERRGREAGMMACCSLLFLSGLLTILQTDGELTSAKEMRSHLWLSAADILGSSLGILVAVVTVALVVGHYERSLPRPSKVAPMDDAEKKTVVGHLKRNLEADEE